MAGLLDSMPLDSSCVGNLWPLCCPTCVALYGLSSEKHYRAGGNNQGICCGGLVQSSKEDSEEDGASFKNFMSTFGAVPVGGRNFFRLLQNKEAVLLFPGGVREVGSIHPVNSVNMPVACRCCLPHKLLLRHANVENKKTAFQAVLFGPITIP